MWLAWMLACVVEVAEPAPLSVCTDSTWSWHEVVVHDPCWGDEGVEWSDADTELWCGADGAFTWQVGDFAYDCTLSSGQMRCDFADSELFGHFERDDLVRGWWVYDRASCRVTSEFSAVRTP